MVATLTGSQSHKPQIPEPLVNVPSAEECPDPTQRALQQPLLPWQGSPLPRGQLRPPSHQPAPLCVLAPATLPIHPQHWSHCPVPFLSGVQQSLNPTHAASATRSLQVLACCPSLPSSPDFQQAELAVHWELFPPPASAPNLCRAPGSAERFKLLSCLVPPSSSSLCGLEADFSFAKSQVRALTTWGQ